MYILIHYTFIDSINGSYRLEITFVISKFDSPLILAEH